MKLHLINNGENTMFGHIWLYIISICYIAIQILPIFLLYKIYLLLKNYLTSSNTHKNCQADQSETS